MYHLPVCSLVTQLFRIDSIQLSIHVTDFSNNICHKYKLGIIHIELCNIKYEERSNFTNCSEHLKVFALKG